MDTENNLQENSQENSHLLPSQIEIIETVQDLDYIFTRGELTPGNEDSYVSCKAISLLSILKECNLAQTPNYYVGSTNSKCGKEFFSYMERNNLIAEEELRILVNTEGYLEKCLDELSPFCQKILLPDESRLENPPKIDPLYAEVENDCPPAFLWSWGPLKTIVVPPQADILSLDPILLEVKRKHKVVPKLLIVMQYRESPLKDCDPYFGAELWYDISRTPLPLSWQERKTIIKMIKY